jgi:carboxymethylenebutenolidase
MINFDSGEESYDGYLAIAKGGRGPGVIVIQEWWGLVGHIKSVADRFAEAGFTAMAPDLYKGRQADEPDEAGKMMMALDIDDVAEVLARAAQYMAEHPAVSSTHVGVVGFCMGGQLSLFAASLSDHIGACVDFYGIHPKVQLNFEEMSAPVLGIFAERDEYASPVAVRNLDEQMVKHEVRHEFITYPGTDHAFFNDDRPEVYNEEAARDAWKRVLDFFRQNLPETKS